MKIEKLENPVRIAELEVEETIKKIGIKNTDVICDIGAGTGVFTLPIAKITDNTVYALDTDDKMLAYIKSKAELENITSISYVKVKDYEYEVNNNVVDVVLLVAVLHEIANKKLLFAEISRILKDSGRIAILEFHKDKTEYGPPYNMRISKDEAISMCEDFGYSKLNDFNIGKSYYCAVFEKAHK